MGSVSKLSRNPQGISKDAWYYEEKGGLLFIVYPPSANSGGLAIKFTVPWRKIKASLKRKDTRRERGGV